MSFLIRALLKIIGYGLQLFPRRVHMLIGQCLGIFFYDVIRLRRNVIFGNLTFAYPHLSKKQRHRIGRASLVSQGQILIEYFILLSFRKTWFKKQFTFEGMEYLEEAYRSNKGAHLLTLHIGNGDYAGAGLAQQGYVINLITKKAKQQWLNDIWFEMRTKLGVKLIPHEKSNMEIFRALRRNEAVIWVLDQFMGPPSGVKVKFFGKETGAARGMAVFVEKTRAPVLPCYNFRRANGTFHLVIEKPIPFQEKEDHEATILWMTQIYTDKLEEIVRKVPEQWMWIHRRWKNFG